jgi:hypothetical protein
MFVDFGDVLFWSGNFSMDDVAHTLSLKVRSLYSEATTSIYGGRLNWFMEIGFIPSKDFEKFKKLLATYKKVDNLRLLKLQLELAKYKTV